MGSRFGERASLHALPYSGSTQACLSPDAAAVCDEESCTLSANLFRIERLAVHDGPGIRTVLFFKGCPLRCKWCSTPESQTALPETLYKVEQCTACGSCVNACPKGALSLSPVGSVHTDRSLCTGLGFCVEACPYEARKWVGDAITLDQVMAEIEKDEIFYHRSGGGITLSGGEPLLQPAFAEAVLAAARMRGISTAMETCGHFSWDNCKGVGRHLDLVYVDIKHADPARHEALTGVRNESILENIQRMAGLWTETDLVVRIPVVPGLNDDPKNLQETATVVQALDRVSRVELLPYHRYGVATYERLGREYSLKNLRPPSSELLQAVALVFSSRGLSVRIGG
ncbi:MAG: glycyl-radical enzyme activating protein [Desulfobacteraceae bacterium]